MIQILSIRLSEAGSTEADIVAFRWYNPDTGAISEANTEAMFSFMSRQGEVYICNGQSIFPITLLKDPGSDTKYLFVTPRGTLLKLPRF